AMISPLFPYTTLFRSRRCPKKCQCAVFVDNTRWTLTKLPRRATYYCSATDANYTSTQVLPVSMCCFVFCVQQRVGSLVPCLPQRSEEHTSELQSPCNL